MAVTDTKAFDCKRVFEARLQVCLRQLRRYRLNSDAEAIHDLRTSIRRLQAAFSVVPEPARSPESTSFMNLLGQLFKLNSQVRDCDVIAEKLAQHSQPPQALIAELDSIRQIELQRAVAMAVEVGALETPNILECPDDSWQRRIQEIRRRALRIDKRQPQVIEDEAAIDELHELRKDMKKLFYLLELHDSIFTGQQKEELRRLQKVAGAIRDCDITLDFLRQLESPSNDAAASIQVEQGKRRKLYADFSKELASRRWQKLLTAALTTGSK